MEYVLSVAPLMLCGHLFSFLCPNIYSASSAPVYLALHVSFHRSKPFSHFSTHTRLFQLFPSLLTAPLTKMAINRNSKKARVARARHAAAQRNNCTAPGAPPSCTPFNYRRTIPEDSDGSHSEGPEGPGHHQSRPSTPEPEGPNLVVPDIESLRATRNAL